MAKRKPTTDDIKAGLTKTKLKSVLRDEDLLSTGSTLLNLACTGRAAGGFAKGFYNLIVGDSKAGKTWISLSCLAEAARNPNFDNYRFIYDDIENGALMNFDRYFGKGLVNRLIAPAYEDGLPSYSRTIEDFYFNLDDALKHKQPCIYVCDSIDCLSSRFEGEKFQEIKQAVRKGRDVSGIMTDGKAKINSSGIRGRLADIRDTGSIVIVINQTRDNVGGGMFEAKKTRSGGRALKFYATTEMWLSLGKTINKDVRGKKRQIGANSRIKVERSRWTGRERTVEIPIYHSLGIDDVGSCVRYLIDEGHWTAVKGRVTAPEFDHEGLISGLIADIEDKGTEDDLAKLVEQVWQEIEQSLVLDRKPRYE